MFYTKTIFTQLNSEAGPAQALFNRTPFHSQAYPVEEPAFTRVGHTP